eukprot:350735-Chlamydomonas_euryale.AAC.2
MGAPPSPPLPRRLPPRLPPATDGGGASASAAAVSTCIRPAYRTGNSDIGTLSRMEEATCERGLGHKSAHRCMHDACMTLARACGLPAQQRTERLREGRRARAEYGGYRVPDLCCCMLSGLTRCCMLSRLTRCCMLSRLACRALCTVDPPTLACPTANALLRVNAAAVREPTVRVEATATAAAAAAAAEVPVRAVVRIVICTGS